MEISQSTLQLAQVGRIIPVIMVLPQPTSHIHSLNFLMWDLVAILQ